jgi:hypothetical protein
MLAVYTGDADVSQQLVEAPGPQLDGAALVGRVVDMTVSHDIAHPTVGKEWTRWIRSVRRRT